MEDSKDNAAESRVGDEHEDNLHPKKERVAVTPVAPDFANSLLDLVGPDYFLLAPKKVGEAQFFKKRNPCSQEVSQGPIEPTGQYLGHVPVA